MKNTFRLLLILVAVFWAGSVLVSAAQTRTAPPKDYPVSLDSENLFTLSNGIGVLSAEKRAEEISGKLQKLLQDDHLNYDDMVIVPQDGHLILRLGEEPIMAVTKSDALAAQSSVAVLAELYRQRMVEKLKTARAAYSRQVLINDALYTLAFLAGLFVFFWLCHKVFPWIYKKIDRIESFKGKSIKFRGNEIFLLRTGVIINLTLRALRFILSLFITYYFVDNIFRLWPYTQTWNLQPIIQSAALLIFYTVLLLTIVKGVNALTRRLAHQYDSWKGTTFKSLKIQSVELLSAEQIVELATFITKVARFALFIIFFYAYITVAFGLFEFSETWSDTLVGYILSPLKIVFLSLLKYLPNLFYISVIFFVFYYVIKLVRFFFVEIDKGAIQIAGFYKDWAMPTFKIVRFLILALALIIIFPYLPGSDSPFFKGITVFLGILFSLGSTSAIANIVAGGVLTYMRPFKIGDRVQIADTMGDVIEKTLLVTRIRTVKNVEITIPNGMILGSHIINYSSAAADRGLILHTTVTIGYDAPWKKVSDLLITAARETQGVLQAPEPFVLQKSLDDFYVSYELNAYTHEPGKMAAIYSDLHAKIQDTFNEAGIEIMSPHYGAVRDGNQTTVPEEYLPQNYHPPAFRIFGMNLSGKPDKNKL